MPTIQQKIADKFLEKIAQSDKIGTGKIEKLRALLSDKKKSKAEDFVKIFTDADGGGLK